MEKTIQILSEKLVYANNYGELFDDEVAFLPQNSTGTYVRWKWTAPFSVAVLAVDQSGKAYLVQNFRHSARALVTEVVKGFGEEDENPNSTAMRELAEEIQMTGDLEHFGSIFTDAAFAYHPIHLFIAWDCRKHAGRPEGSEAISRIVSFRLETDSAKANQEIQDAVTLVLLKIAVERLGDRENTNKVVPDRD
jgi:8-oxo-dGTP pyrophosphatase MutT (NUDIX family)